MYDENDYGYWNADKQKYVDCEDTYTRHDLPGLIVHDETGLVINKNSVGAFETSTLFKMVHGDIKVTVDV